MISVIICLEQSIPCELCAIKFTRKPNLNIQMRSLHDIISNTCMYWQKHFLQPSQLSEHFVASLLITDHFGSCSAFLSTLFLACAKIAKIGMVFQYEVWNLMIWHGMTLWSIPHKDYAYVSSRTHMCRRGRICVVEDAYVVSEIS